MRSNKNPRAKQQLTVLGSISLSSKLDIVYSSMYEDVGSADLYSMWNWLNYADWSLVQIKMMLTQSMKEVGTYETD